MSSLALNFVKENKNIDKIVIGAESKLQLEDNILAMKKDLEDKTFELINNINLVDRELLNPVNWK